MKKSIPTEEKCNTAVFSLLLLCHKARFTEFPRLKASLMAQLGKLLPLREIHTLKNKR